MRLPQHTRRDDTHYASSNQVENNARDGAPKIVLLVLLAIPLLPLSVVVVTALLQAMNNLLWQLSYVLPSWLVLPVTLLAYALPVMVGIWWLMKLLRKGQ